MAEEHGGSLKTSDFFLGVVEVFAVMLPGAILDFLILECLGASKHVTDDAIKLFTPMFSPRAVGYLAFAVAAYVTGHLLFAVGGLVLDPLYGRFKELGDTELQRFRERAREILGPPLHIANWEREKENALAWTEAYLRINSGPGTAQLERLEADSKFFRSLCLILLIGFPLTSFVIERFTYAHGRYSIRVAFLIAIGLLALQWLWKRGRDCDSLKNWLKEHNQELLWTWCLAWLIPFTIWLYPYWRNWKVGLFVAGWAATALLCCWRFFDIREKRTRIAYELLVVSNQFKPASEAGGRRRSAFQPRFPLYPALAGWSRRQGSATQSPLARIQRWFGHTRRP